MDYEFGSYKVISLIGEGGMNRVYLVADVNGKQWALKQTREPSEISRTPEEVRDQFEREVLTLSSLSHPNLPILCEYFSSGRHHYIVEEFVDGISLEKYILSHRMSEIETLELAITLCNVLEYLHGRNIIYRDLKPANIIVTKESTLKLLDFDISRTYKKGKKSDTIALGTPGYAAPETYGISQSDARSDIYSLGATLYHILTGDDPQEHPFIFEPIGYFRDDITDRLIEAVERALSRSPEMRYRSAVEMKKALMKIWGKSSAKPPSLVAFLRRVVSQVFSIGSPHPQPQALKPAASGAHPAGGQSASAGGQGTQAAGQRAPGIGQGTPAAGKFTPFNRLPPLVQTSPGSGASLPNASNVNPHMQSVAPAAGASSSISHGASAPGAGQPAANSVPSKGSKTPVGFSGSQKSGHAEDDDDDDDDADVRGATLRGSDSMGRTPLHLAIIEGKDDRAFQMVLRGENVNRRDSSGMAPLDWALMFGRLAVARLLIEKGADLSLKDSDGKTALHRAVMLGCGDLAAKMLKSGADMYAWDDNGCLPLHYARNCDIALLFFQEGFNPDSKNAEGRGFLHLYAQDGNLKFLELFINKGADCNIRDRDGRAPLHDAVLRHDEKALSLLIEKGADSGIQDLEGNTPLHTALDEGVLNCAGILIMRGSGIGAANRRGETPLHIAAQKGHQHAAGLILEKGADISSCDSEGKTPLHNAVLKGFWSFAGYLLDSGAPVDAKDAAGKTVLHYTVKESQDEQAAFFLDRGADISAGDGDGRTPLHYAVMEGDYDMVCLLLRRGAPCDIADRVAMTPYDWALYYGNKELMALLKEK
jgi:ankyrin repeat protein/tRNA A-37 threonylcarbamoyl transferase component Bud32